MKKLLLSLLLLTQVLTAATFNVATTPELRTVLETTATNGEDDTIILADGTYKTTDDGGGTFIYFSNEANNLTLQGSSSDNVILSGDNVEQIFKHTSTEGAPLKLEKLTFMEGNTTAAGAGVYTDYSIEVVDCNFNNNSAGGNGGAFRAYQYTTVVTNSTFNNNSSKSYGGGFSSSSRTTTVTNSTFNNNSAGINGGGFMSSSTTVVTNSLFNLNSSGIYISKGEQNKVLNNIFIDNNESDITAEDSVIISKLENNYLDTSKVTVSNFKKNNIFDGVNLGFVDIDNGDYHLTVNSDLIDAGATDIEDVTLPTTDLDGNKRVVGSSIDIGPYEFSSTKPTISNFTFSGNAKELSELTFSVDYAFDGDSTLDSISFDYNNDGNYVSLNTHTFDTSGIYTVNVKVTDSEGEFSIKSLDITIIPLPFEDMTDQQKLVKAIDPQYYDEIMSIINSSSSNGSDYSSFDWTTDSLNISQLTTGWTLTGTPMEITDLSIFDSAKLIWIYDKDSTTPWSAYSHDTNTMSNISDSSDIGTITTIPANSGIWVYKD
jgi:predicted outer membrane repeat protein